MSSLWRRVGFCAFWFDDLKSAEAVRQCARTLREMGYPGVEFKLDSFDVAGDWERIFTEASGIAREEGLEITDFVILRNLCAADADERRKNVGEVIRAARAAVNSGAPKLNFIGGGVAMERDAAADWYRPSRDNNQAQWERLEASLEEIIKALEGEGITLALEPCTGQLVHDLGTTRELLYRVDSEALGLTFDPSHFALYGDDVLYAASSLFPRIRHVHLKDVVGHPGEMGRDFLFPLPGEGCVDLPALVRQFETLGYEGSMVIEFESFQWANDVLGGDAVRIARLCRDYIEGILVGSRD